MKVLSRGAAILLGETAELSGSSSSASKSSMGRMGKGKRRDGSSRREQNSDGSGKRGCRELIISTALAGTSKCSDSDSLKERGTKVSSSREHTSMAVAETTSRSICKDDMGEK